MASQRITVAKVGGVAAQIIVERLREWSSARQISSSDEWSPEQWPQHVRERADDFADQLRAHAFSLPVVHFIEWVDMWSVGDLFARWLTPPDGPIPFVLYANRYQVFAYILPDGGRLAQHLAAAGPQQSAEANWFVSRLREVVEAWQELVAPAVVVVVRNVLGSTVLDEEITASLRRTPEWLS